MIKENNLIQTTKVNDQETRSQLSYPDSRVRKW